MAQPPVRRRETFRPRPGVPLLWRRASCYKPDELQMHLTPLLSAGLLLLAADFYLPTDPDLSVVEFHYGLYDGHPNLSIAAGGTATYHPDPSQRRAPERTHRYEYQELQSLVRAIVATGILELDVAATAEELRQTRRLHLSATGALPISTDLGVYTITLRLRDYRSAPDADWQGQVDRTIIWSEQGIDLRRAAGLYPAIEGLKVLVAVADLIEAEIKKTHSHRLSNHLRRRLRDWRYVSVVGRSALTRPSRRDGARARGRAGTFEQPPLSRSLPRTTL